MNQWLAAFARHINPTATLPESVRRQSHLLAWLQLFSLLMTTASLSLVLLDNPPGSPRRAVYMALVFGLLILLMLAYRLNRIGYYVIAASLTIACSVLGPWSAMILDPTILEKDMVPLIYVTLPVLLSSLLLRPSITTLLTMVQLLAFAFIPLFSPATVSINWPSFLIFYCFTAVLSIVASVISQRDLAQIDHQTRLLSLSEARLREDSIRDHLTNLFNRRYLEETLERELQRAARRKLPLGVIVLDIDFFKRVNDEWGHDAGDTLLQGLGQLLTAHVRLSDIACRFGGEEFVLILPEASLQVTTERAELLREKVRQLQLQHNLQKLETVTASFGVAIFPDHGSTGEAVLKSADAVLYRAKREGRDRVIVASKLAS